MCVLLKICPTPAYIYAYVGHICNYSDVTIQSG